MTSVNPAGNPAHQQHTGVDPAAAGRPRRLSAEMKSALKTTEFFIYLAAVVAVLIASMVVGPGRVIAPTSVPIRRAGTS